MKRKRFLPMGHSMPTPHPAPRTPHPAPRKANGALLKMVLLFMTIFVSDNLMAQSGCHTDLVTLDIPSEFGSPPELSICDLEFTATLTITHSYTAAHNYTVSFAFDPAYIGFVDTDPTLSNVTFGTDIFDNTLVTGTYTAPYEDEFSIVELQARFSRLNYWSANNEGITFKVSDASCSPALQFDDFQAFFVEPHFDLRSYSQTSLSELWDDGNGVLQVSVVNSELQLPNLLIDDELVIDLPAAMIGDVNLKRNITLMPGASIRIPGNGNLRMELVNVHTCPDAELAEGIVVEAGGSSPLTKLRMKNSIVSDCRYGINAKPGSSLSLLGNQFVNNYIGVYLNMYGTTSSAKRVRIDGFEGNEFFTDGALKQPYSGMTESVETKGYCGIWLNDYMDFNVWGDNDAMVTDGNDFHDLANGIIAYRTTANLGNMSFSNMFSSGSPAYPLEGFGIYLNGKGGNFWANVNEPGASMTFSNCKTGVKAIQYAGNVENTDMEAVEIGIDWENSRTKDITLAGNRISAENIGIRSFSNEPLHPVSIMLDNAITMTGSGSGTMPATGILANESQFGKTIPLNSGWRIISDTVVLEDGGRGILYRNGYFGNIGRNIVTNLKQDNNYDGIWADGATITDVIGNVIDQDLEASGLGDSRCIRSAGGWANTYACNCLDNTNTGLQFFDMGDFTDNVNGNLPHNHTYGLQMGDENIGNVFIGTQTHTGNEWDLNGIPSGGYGGVHWGSDQNIIGLSTFYVDENENASFNPPVDPGDNQWFEDESTQEQTFTCGISCSFPEPPQPPNEGETDVPTRLDQMIAADSLPVEVFEDETRWKGAYRLYRKMLRRPAIVGTSTLYSDFKTANDSLSTGRLAYIAEEKGKLFSLDSTQYAIFNGYRETLLERVAGLDTLDRQLQSGTSVDQAEYDTLVQQRIQSQTSLGQYVAYLDSLRQLRISYLLQLNAAVSTSLAPAANHKTVNTILLDWLATDDIASSDMETLISIAGQCPLEGGDAVYEARSLVSHFAGTEFDDRDLCGTQNRQARGKKGPTLDRVIVFPNPTIGRINWTGAENATIRVLNAQGQVALTIRSTKGSADLGNLPQGFYVVQLFSADNILLATQKIQLVKH